MDVCQIISDGTVETEAGCWEWQRCTQSNGYGRIRMNGRTEYAHRVAYMSFKGVIADGMDVCHTCDNRRCCNPDHLFVGSRADNMRDAKDKGRIAHGEIHSERICGEKGPGAKLTLSKVCAIRRSAARGAKTGDLAILADVTTDTIRAIVRGATWKDEDKCAA